MKTYFIQDEIPQHCWAFEIRSVYISLRKLAHLLANVDGVSDVRKWKIFRSKGDIRIKFKYEGREFVVWEPWGDSNRYWIGPLDETDKLQDIEPIRRALSQYQPNFLVKILGALISLDFETLGSFFKRQEKV